MKALFVAAISATTLLVLASCAAPPGQLKDDDFDWSESSLSIPPGEVYAGLQNYARVCGGILEQAPEWYPTQTGDGAKVDLFMRGLAGQTEFVYGVIELGQAPGGGTIAKTGVQTIYSKPAFRKRGWWIEKIRTMFSEIETSATPSCP
ncbi:hypothetical protein ADE_11580 [Achromobacter denitrificans]|uniref:hypothetical protein n=1 Tax=Achromobacter denitrificans TaxID=32002 RepID=UPI00166A0A01|nr:hypothetical protein [Achromobacter denitrificans]GFN25460.1 hypothetical protein ADE_11580 [Achromobacter denitrificans]